MSQTAWPISADTYNPLAGKLPATPGEVASGDSATTPYGRIQAQLRDRALAQFTSADLATAPAEVIAWLTECANELVAAEKDQLLSAGGRMPFTQPAHTLRSSAAPTFVRQYPGAFPCDTTLQACIDGSDPGDEIDLQFNTYLTSVTLNKAQCQHDGHAFRSDRYHSPPRALPATKIARRPLGRLAIFYRNETGKEWAFRLRA